MEIFCGILSVPHNDIMDMNNVMYLLLVIIYVIGGYLEVLKSLDWAFVGGFSHAYGDDDYWVYLQTILFRLLYEGSIVLALRWLPPWGLCRGYRQVLWIEAGLLVVDYYQGHLWHIRYLVVNLPCMSMGWWCTCIWVAYSRTIILCGLSWQIHALTKW